MYSNDIDIHVCHVRAFLQQCKEKNIHLSQQKFIFAQKEIEFAGAILSTDGYKMKPRVCEAIEKPFFPKCLTEMRTF